MIPILLAFSGLGGYSLSRRALRPVDLLISEAQSITAEDLSRRLPVPQAKDELQRLAYASNDLLSRLELAMRRVAQFTADASHELRNPIAYIRATAEFHLQNADLDEMSPTVSWRSLRKRGVQQSRLRIYCCWRARMPVTLLRRYPTLTHAPN